MSKDSKKKNPLFVVTNNGQDVEEASGLFDAFIKKFGLAPVLEFLENIFQMILAQVSSYPMLVAFQKFLDEFIIRLEQLIKVVDPVTAFRLFKR